jgi:hypothetical protein
MACSRSEARGTPLLGIFVDVMQALTVPFFTSNADRVHLLKKRALKSVSGSFHAPIARYSRTTRALQHNTYNTTQAGQAR